jgi:hypothetical protein
MLAAPVMKQMPTCNISFLCTLCIMSVKWMYIRLVMSVYSPFHLRNSGWILMKCETSIMLGGYCNPYFWFGQHDGSLQPYSRLSRLEPLFFFFQVTPQFYSRGWVDPVPYPLLLRKYGSAGNRTRTSGSVEFSESKYGRTSLNNEVWRK